jgi:peptide/nickel transport system substrate-binding protein
MTRALSVVAVGALALTGCASERGAASESEGGTFVFAGASDPVSLDPALAMDSESARVNVQMFEGLVGYQQGSADIQPLLATSWTQSDDGLSYTFQLREGVAFSDGTDFDADAVCYNFERWYNWTGPLQAQNVSNLYQLVFGGFKTSDDPALVGSLYKSCETSGAHEATINLTRTYGAFIPALALVEFAMQSPTALREYDADNVTGSGADVRFGEYATAHPTGTGPFVFDSWDRGQQLTLKANPNYWGEKPLVDTAIVKIIGDPTARTQALRNGEIDGYDLVAPGDISPLRDAGFTLLNRDPFNVLYLGMDQTTPALKDPLVRQAISYAIDKESLAAQTLPEGAKPAIEFVPPTVDAWTDQVDKRSFDLAKAKELLAQAGQSDLALDFYYPTGTSRPYMPNPEDLFVALRTQLEAAGITVNGIPLKWSPEYMETIKSTPDHGLFLLGATLTLNTAEVLGIFFGGPNTEWGFDNPELFASVAAARAARTTELSAEAYAQSLVMISEFIPGVPLAHVPVTVALAPNVEGYVTNPTSNDLWNTVTVK